MLIPLYTNAALSDGKSLEEDSLIHVFFHLPPDTQVSVKSSDIWHSIKSGFTEVVQQKSFFCERLEKKTDKGILLLEKRRMLEKQRIPLTLDDNYAEIIISSHAKTIIEFENVQVAITNAKFVNPKKTTFYIAPASLKGANKAIKVFSRPELKRLPHPHICLQYGDSLQDDSFFVLKNYPLADGEEDYVSSFAPKTTITFSESGRSYPLPEDFCENDEAAFHLLAPGLFLAVTPTKACLLQDDSENTDDESRGLIVKEIPCFEESAAMLDQDGEGYYPETRNIVLYDENNVLQTYDYDQTEVKIRKLAPVKALPSSPLCPKDKQKPRAKKRKKSRYNRQKRSSKTNACTTKKEESSTALKQQNTVASTSEA